MNILLVSDAYLPTVSGVASSSDSIARFMVSRGHQVTLVAPKPLDGFIPKPAQGLEFVFTPGISDSLFVNKSMTVFPIGFGGLWKVFRTHRFHIVHIQEPGSLGITAIILAKLFRVPIVGAMHFSWPQIERVAPSAIRWISVPFMKLYVRIVYRAYNAIMVPTKTAARDLVALIGRTEQIHAVSNGVDTHVYVPRKGSPDALRKKYQVPASGAVFLYIGRLDADKNVETTLLALSRLKKPYVLIIGGVGRQKDALVALADDLGISGHIIWMEGLNQQTIVELYQLSDVFVIMSPVETQSIVALQAISCGLPLVAARAGALPELVDGTNGFLVGTQDVDALTQVLVRLRDDPKLRISMGKRGREIARTHHKPDMLAMLESLYKTTIGNRE